MQAKGITPILNVSDIYASFTWFEKLGWTKGWEWGTPSSFGCDCSGECEIFLCEGGQGGKGELKATFGSMGEETADKGVWMSIWVDNVDTIHERCVSQELEVTLAPEDMPWNVREMHVRHPDGHVFRIGSALTGNEAADDA